MSLAASLLQRFKKDLKAHPLFWGLLGVGLCFRLFIMAQIGFIDDEAYHWTWAKNLSYSYYDHPGMVAWMIWPFSTIFGDHAFVIRLPSFFMFCGILYLIYKLASEIFDDQTGRIASLLVFVIPLWGFASLGTLPDVPLAFFWILLFYIFWQSVKPTADAWSVKKTWLWLGFIMGLGMNSKLTCCLIGLGFGLYLLLTPRLRRHLLSPWPYVGMLITFAMMAPVFLWNMNHHWASFEYQFLRRHTEAHGADWNRWLQFWSYQWIFMSPGIYFFMLWAMLNSLLKWKDERWRLLLLVPLPALALFYYQPLMSAYKPHWSGPAYMIVFLGAIYLLRIRKIGIAISAFFLIILNSIYIPLLTPIIPKAYAHFKDASTWEPKWDFSNEFHGWIEVGDHVKALQKKYAQETGTAPFFGAQRYELISQLWWGTKQKVWQMTQESDQFFFDQPAEDKQKLIGQNFLIVNNDKYPRDPMEITQFDNCEKTDFPIYRGTTLARTFYVYYCKNFRGFK